MRQQQVAVVLPSLLGGGAERVATDLANHWSQQSRLVTLVTIDRCAESHYPIDGKIRRIGLDLMVPAGSPWTAIWNNLLRVRKLRRVLHESSATTVVSFTDVTNVTTLLACRGARLRTIVCERTDPRHHRISRPWRWLRQQTYGRSDAIVVQTASVRAWAKSCDWTCPVLVIPNAAPSAVPRADREPDSPAAPRMLAGLGRLSEEKGFHHLIAAFAKIASRHLEWQLTIFGEGPERGRLQRLIQDSRLESRIELPGWKSDAASALARADLFVLPSRYEGFPNALLEAMAAGLPCVSFDCDSGPREIIRHGIDGLLVPPGNVPRLAETLAELMADRVQRERLGMAAREVSTRFSRAEFYRRWDAVLDGDAP